jgi:hypothetical protein
MSFDFLTMGLKRREMLRDNYIGVPTEIGKAQRALDYVNKYRNSINGWWLLVGRRSEWPNEDVVPLPIPTVSKIPDVVGFWKLRYVNLVYKDPNGKIYTPDLNFNTAETNNYEEVLDTRASAVLLSTSVDADSYGDSFTFRILGICTSISLSADVDIKNKMYLKTEEVSSYFLDWYANCKAVSVSNNDDYKVNIIRSF